MLPVRQSKKGIMGIETLIIFIAMIIVAAIAAGVLLRTQGVLQQKSLAVANEARERVVTGLEIISITANIDNVDFVIRSFEMLVRLRAGSSDIQLKVLGLALTTQLYSNQMALMNRDMPSYEVESIVNLSNTSNHTLSINLDYDPQDPDTERVRLVNGSHSPDGLSALEVHLGNGTWFRQPLGINFTSIGTAVNITDFPLQFNSSVENSPVYGYVSIGGTTTGQILINTSTGSNWSVFKIETDVDTCDLDTLVPDYKFCYTTRLGNSNTIMEGGEIINLRFRASDGKLVGPSAQVELQVIPKDGTIEVLSFTTPPVFSRIVQTLWP
jgi:flagellin-like protein